MSYIRFLGEVMTQQFCFEINWPLAVSKPYLSEKVLWKNLTLTRKQQKAESCRLLVCMDCRIRIWTTVTGDKRVFEISKNSTFEKYRRIRSSKFEKSKKSCSNMSILWRSLVTLVLLHESFSRKFNPGPSVDPGKFDKFWPKITVYRLGQ